jgi:hypothetical protein
MPTVVAVVVCCRRAFSGGATARVVGDAGGGCDGPSWPFGCRAVMIAYARVPCRLSVVGPPVSGRRSHLQLMCTARGLGSMAPLDL